MPKHALEYDEEEEGGDLFGSEDERAEQSQTSPGFAEYNTAIPIVTPLASSTPVQPQAGPSRAHTSSKGADMAVEHIWPDAQTRLSDLRAMKRQNIPLGQGTGSRSLREACMKVIRTNGKNIWHVGDVPYTLLKPFIDYLPMAQLVEIEENSPNLKKDTDWLWEVFMLQEFPLYHERVRERKGEPRTHGWRRMHKTAQEEDAARKASAQAKAAALYKRLEEEKQAKKIVKMDHLPPESNKKRKGKVPIHTPASHRPSAITTSAAMNKARSEISRAKVALAHASGHATAPPPRPRPTGVNQLYVNPYLAKPSSTPANGSLASGSRVAVPRTALPPNGGLRPAMAPKHAPASKAINGITPVAKGDLPKWKNGAMGDFFDHPNPASAATSKDTTPVPPAHRVGVSKSLSSAPKRPSPAIDPAKALFMPKKPRLSGR